LFNPLSSFKCDFGDIKITNFYNDVKWYFPKMKNGQLLATPLGEKGKKKPQCAYFIKDISRQCEILDYGALI
jgi:ADP-dependent phosphofructokinase/glucokinase